MADSIAAAHRGLDAIRTVLPDKFNWPTVLCGAGVDVRARVPEWPANFNCGDRRNLKSPKQCE
jgi:hypothetical protein